MSIFVQRINPATQSPFLSRKLRGANIAPKPGGHGWQGLFAEWDWTNWIQPQIDRALALGFNAVRLIGAPRAIFVDPDGTNISKITQTTYDARWTQLAQYCLSKGLSLYPSLVQKWDYIDAQATVTVDYQAAAMTTSIITTAAVLAGYRNVIGFDLFMEGDSNTGTAWTASTAYTIDRIVNNGSKSYKVTIAGTSASTGGPTGTGTGITDGSVTWAYQGTALLPADVFAMMDAVRTAAHLPVTMSRSIGDGFGWADTTSIWYTVFTTAGGADFLDFHLYDTNYAKWAVSTAYALAAKVNVDGRLYKVTTAGTSASTGTGPTGTGSGITDGTVTWAYFGSPAPIPADPDFIIRRSGKPLLIGEYGVNQAETAGQQTTLIRAAIDIHNRRHVLGSFVWALADQDTVTTNQWGIWDNTGYAQTFPAASTAPLSTTAGKRTAITDLRTGLVVADAPDVYKPPNMLGPIQARVRNSSTGAVTGWAGLSNTFFYDDPRGLGFSATAGALTSGVSTTPVTAIPVLGLSYYKATATFLAGATARTMSLNIDWYNAAGTYITSSTAVTGTDATTVPLTLVTINVSPTLGAFAVILCKCTSAGGSPVANEAHIVMDASLEALYP